MTSPVQAIIFDFDGVIIDTETPDFETWRDIFQARGLDLSPDLWIRRVGAANDNLFFEPAAHYAQITGKPLEAEVITDQRAAYLARCKAQPILPGVLELIQYAKDHSIKLAIASNSVHDWVEDYAAHVGVRPYFSCISTRSDVMHAKPAPDVYLNAAACLGVLPERCLAVEDSPTGMRAAIAAGIRVIGVLTPLTTRLPQPDGVALFLHSIAEMPPEALIARFG